MYGKKRQSASKKQVVRARTNALEAGNFPLNGNVQRCMAREHGANPLTWSESFLMKQAAREARAWQRSIGN